MRFIMLALIGVILSSVTAATPTFSKQTDDMRAVWVSTVYNLDFPSQKGDPAAQKKQFSEMLDNFKDKGINTVIAQVRPNADALYKSNLNPWSSVLTGEQGKDPGYDPLEYMIAETKARGMELHAWLNPYRIAANNTDINSLAPNHPARLNPSWVMEYDGGLYYNPEKAEVVKHITDTVTEIVKNYDVDGVHFDDYFYPANYPLPPGEDKDGAAANARRANVNDMVAKVYSAIKAVKPDVSFGISPMGIWKNASSDPKGSATAGAEGYYSVYGDVLAWIEAGTVDYIAPQIYWKTGSNPDYETLVKWWSERVKDTNVSLCVGHANYKDDVAAEMGEQLKIAAKYNVQGDIFFRAADIINNRKGCADAIKNFYANKQTSVGADTELYVIEPIKPTEQAAPNFNNPPTVSLTDIEQTETAIVDVIRITQAAPTNQKITVDGAPIAFDAYNIDGNNYFKLRDVAAALNASDAKFNVVWDAAKSAVNILTGQTYQTVGGELATGGSAIKTAETSVDSVYIDGAPKRLEAYKIDGNNYYRLRDLASYVGVNVNWNEASNTVEIVTDKN